jgi:hypothetical protein
MRKPTVVLACILALCALEIRAQTAPVSAADEAAIRQTALDYIQGFYEGNAERMERALHPDVAKRIVRSGPQGQDRLDNISAGGLVQATRTGGGKTIPKDKQTLDVTILDVYGNTASVKIVAGLWVDYLHVAKFNGRWVIVNVLWELKPRVMSATQDKTESKSAATKVEKYAMLVGEYNSPSGVMVVSQEGNKLFAETNGQSIELVPESEADKFNAQPIGAQVSFVRDAGEKVVGIKIVMPNGRELTGNKTK